MKLPKKWLSEYVDLNVTNAELVEKMMWRGFECAGVVAENYFIFPITTIANV